MRPPDTHQILQQELPPLKVQRWDFYHGLLGEALHRELKPDGITVTVLCPGMSDTGFATAAEQKITPTLKLLMMQAAPVVRAGIRALQAGRISVVPGWANKATVIFVWATPRWLHQAIFSRIMNA